MLTSVKQLKYTASKSLLAAVLLAAPLSACKNIDSLLVSEATIEAIQAITLTNEQVAALSRQAAAQQDQTHTVAPANNAYNKRLNRLVQRHYGEDGLTLNYKVYLSESVNAFAMADGTVRVYSGLMDAMSDHELLFVIGHEVGHVKLGHSHKQAQLAYATSAVRKGVSALGGTVGELAKSELGVISTKIVNAQFSQKEEKEADDYGVQFMRRHGYPVSAAVSSLNKLGGGGGGLLSSHPDSKERAERLKKQM